MFDLLKIVLFLLAVKTLVIDPLGIRVSFTEGGMITAIVCSIVAFSTITAIMLLRR